MYGTRMYIGKAPTIGGGGQVAPQSLHPLKACGAIMEDGDDEGGVAHEVEEVEGAGEDESYESDEGTMYAANDSVSTYTPSVWERMAANIEIGRLDDGEAVQLIVDGLRTEHGRSQGGQALRVRCEPPNWKDLALSTLKRTAVPISDQQFDRKWNSSAVREQGCEVLIQQSRESNAEKHERIVRDEVYCGTDGTFYNRSTLSEYELAMHFLLTRADDIVIIMSSGGASGYMYWSHGRWIEESDRGSSLLAADVMDASHCLFNDLHEHHAKKLKQAIDNEMDKEVVSKAESRSKASRLALARYGNRQNRDVVQLILNAKKRMAVMAADDPFDQRRHLLPFTNGVIDLKTRIFRSIRKDDYVLRTTGREWRPPTENQIKRLREIFESMLPDEGPRKTMYCLLRLAISGEAAERFWMLTGSGRNGKGLVMSWMRFLLGDDLYSDMPMGALTAPLTGMGPAPELRKAHRRRLLNWAEPPEDEDDESSNMRKRGIAILLDNVKRITGEDNMPARDCSSNDSRCDLWGTTVLQCNKMPRLIGRIDDSAIERIIVITFPFTFTADAEKQSSNPSKYKPLDIKLKSREFMKEHYCALVQLLLDECPYGKLFIAPECRKASNVYLGKQDVLQRFLDDFCIREETSPVRQWLGVKEMLASYNTQTESRMKEKDFKEKLKAHRTTSADYCEKGAATISDKPLRRNTANGLLHWRLRAQEAGESSSGVSGSKRSRELEGGGGV